MTRVPTKCRHRVPVLGLAVVVLASACSGVGTQTAANPYDLVCADENAYVHALDIGDDAKITEAVARMNRDFNLIPDQQPRMLLLQAVYSALRGDPSPIRQSFLANCAPTPSPSPTTSESSPSRT